MNALSSIRSLPARARALAGDAHGTTIVEFGIFAPILAMLVIGMVDYGRAFSERYLLESAAHRAMERAFVGTTQSDYSYLRQEAATAANVPLANVTLDNWLECNGTRKTSYSDSCDSSQQVTRYVYVKIEQDFVPTFSWSTGGRTLRLSGDAAVRVQ